MAKDLEKTLSDKIEDTIEGVLRFAVRFARTVAVILATPWSAIESFWKPTAATNALSAR